MTDSWHYTRSGKQMSPVSTAELRQLAAKGMLKPTDLVWKEGMSQWKRASATPGLFEDSYPGSGPAVQTLEAPPRSRSEAPAYANGLPTEPRPSGPIGVPSRKPQGMSTGAKVGIVIAVVLLLAGLGVAAVLLKINSGKEGDKSSSPTAAAGVVMEYKVTLKSLGKDQREVNLTAGIQYEVNAVNDKGKKFSVFLDDAKGKELVGRHDAVGTGKLIYVPSVTGPYRVELTNLGLDDIEIAVVVRDSSKTPTTPTYPHVVETFKAFVAEFASNRKPIKLKADMSYQFKATNDRECKLDLLVLDDKEKIVAKIANQPKTAMVSYRPLLAGNYSVEVFNHGVGNAEFSVDVIAVGPDAVAGDVVKTWKALIRELNDHAEFAELKAGTRYDFIVTSDAGCRVTVFVNEMAGKQVANLDLAPSPAKLSYTPGMGGRHQFVVINQGKGDSNFTMEIRVAAVGEVVKVDPGIGAIVESYKAVIPDLREDKHFVELKAGTRYEITAISERGTKVDLFLDDETGKEGKEVAKLRGSVGTARLSYTPTATGKHKIEVVNMGIGDSNFTIEVRALGKGEFPVAPGVMVESFKATIASLEEESRSIMLNGGSSYEIIATSDRGGKLDLFLKDERGREVAEHNGAPGRAKVSYAPGVGGRYQINIVNQADAGATFTVEVRMSGGGAPPPPGIPIGKDPFMEFPKFAPDPLPILKDPFDLPKPKFDPEKIEFPPKVALPVGTPLIATKEGARLEGALRAGDLDCPFRMGRFCKVFAVRMVPGRTYTIDMMAGYDTYLFLANGAGAAVVSDDDGGDGTNSRLIYRPTAEETFRIVCTSYDVGTTGNFTLIVREE